MSASVVCSTHLFAEVNQGCQRVKRLLSRNLKIPLKILLVCQGVKDSSQRIPIPVKGESYCRGY